MRTASLVAAFVAASAIGVAAQQATPPAVPPPTAPPPASATPSAARPQASSTPATRPPAARSTKAAVDRASTPGTPVPATAPGQTTPPRAAPPEPLRPGYEGTPGATWQNVRIDVKISDTVNPDAGTSKMVSLICVDGQSGQVRSQSGDGLIHIDAKPIVRSDGRIWVQMTIEYRPELTAQQTQQSGSSRVAGFSESLSLVVSDGKAMVASQSADPKSDRKVLVELTATVQPLK